MVVRYFPIAESLRKHDPISTAFERARTVINEVIATGKAT